MSRRPLTPGEIEMAREMFGAQIDYAAVEIVRKKWIFFQPVGVVMAPTGNIHFHPRSERYSDDFSKEKLTLQGLFIHEMTHVWQTQRGGKWFLPLIRHPFCRYGYELEEGRPFLRYGIEQQAEIVRHRFLADKGGKPKTIPPRALLPFSGGNAGEPA
ncbi:vgr related protein [Sphingomicrobium astaxanthinifaciens]|uniref:vgr related protein n=1 Tax=Sphingomicrobium astaxanthinifaciens TaxID=1227949 RepID=UPI001FCCBB1B|nr:vgr related protein [Sphingomicrobium astaxanthinifaciens]MCJ7422014.1 vgr related protein [Sphingomicrobium astaxanthinifaciens]